MICQPFRIVSRCSAGIMTLINRPHSTNCVSMLMETSHEL